MKTTRTDLVKHNGRTYSLADLAHYMEHEQRETIHAGNTLDETPEGFWARFVAAYPGEADHLCEITPSVRGEE